MALAEADMGMTSMAFQDAGDRDPSDDQLLVKFFWHPEKDEKASTEEGRPIFREVEYIQIQVPGQKDTIVQRPAFAEDKERFPRHWAAFQNKEEMPVSGTPLDQWPRISRAQVEELKYFNIHTVEQLAELSDTNAQNFRAIQNLKREAVAYVEEAKGNAPMVKMAEELEARDNEIDTLKKQMAEMAEDLKAMRESDDSVPDSERRTKSSSGRGRANSSK